MTVRKSDTYLLDRGGAILAGRYRVTDLLAVGGMGSVWIAEHIALRRQVVVKFHEEWSAGSDHAEAVARFMLEARALARIRHRHVTELHEVGSTDDGEPYLIMERLRGRSLAARMRTERRLPLEEAVAITIAILRGLEAVHAAGILHRDVKPENIFLHETDDEGREGIVVPKLLDFGLARRSEGSIRVTDGKKAIGTPGYMAPEQARGRADLDHRVDLYATAVTLYEMLTGDLPSRGATAMERMIWTVQQEPIPLTDHRPDLAGPIAAVVMRALSRERGDRYPSARAVRLALAAAHAEVEDS